ncbi:hypothetical protein [Photobacterium damselae]|uniref:hypothetical protein n=1 Tax=Photobacterium damselae TaxID=38293 RepID=UPI001F393A8D|nr:hypothetical protein [Photobacterium damselae]UKA04759.1 hypothetical protein IHC89_21190 [Photobacterium damselae subsp. damselae]
MKSVFSNGFVDFYKGNRLVEFGWMITNKETKEVVSTGHSISKENALKTATSNTPNKYEQYRYIAGGTITKAGDFLIKKHSLPKNRTALLRFIRTENSAYREKFEIEIVNVVS